MVAGLEASTSEATEYLCSCWIVAGCPIAILYVGRCVQTEAPGVGGAGSGAAADGGPVSSGAAVASPAAVAAALATKPPPPFTNDPQETSLGVWWQKVEGAEGYRLTYRQFPQDWSTATVCVPHCHSVR